MTEKILRSSATELARAIREGELRSVDVVNAHLERIAEVNPRLNAVVYDLASQARRMAKEADAAKERGADLGPLHGVPCTIKESFAMPGTPFTSGLVARIGVRTDETATAVKRLLDAGAIPMGKTNISELCMWMEGDNKVYGRTNNPYDPSRIVGGSSSGEGAIIGAGASPFGLGSDIGGSIRMPAFFNGIFGHKPTGGLIPNTGQYPEAEGRSARYCTTGPLARSAEDLPLLIEIMRGPDGRCAGVKEMPFNDPSKVDLSSLRVLHVRGDGKRRVDPELQRVQDEAARALEAQGATVIERSFPKLERSFEIWAAMLASDEGTSFTEMMGEGKEGGFKVGRELGRFFLGISDHTLPAVVLAALETATSSMDAKRRELVELGLELKRELMEALGEDGIMLYPSHAVPAPRHGVPLLFPFRWVYTGILNMMEIPATQVPMGLSKRGLPLGIQVAANHERDDLTIATALFLEKRFGGWQPPPR